MNETSTTICSISSPRGNGAIAIIRMSGNKAIDIASSIFSFSDKEKNESLQTKKTHTLYHGIISNNNEIIDEVIVSIYKAPNSFTGQDVVEISCHGSIYIQQRIIELLISRGAVLAKPGEFTLRAFLNKKYDLTQAEAIADLIASSSEAEHTLAMKQLRGTFSDEIKKLRSKLLHFTSLIELELDFSDEDVEFANRNELKEFIYEIKNIIEKLIKSFKLGNAIKQGIPVTIIGSTNVGKSTLLNALLKEEKAIVSEIPGTTRDAIEDVYTINGILFRFIDTAGLRNTDDEIEQLGINKTYEKINQAAIILFVFDITETSIDTIKEAITELKRYITDSDKKIIIVANKTDKLIEIPKGFKNMLEWETIFISAKRNENINLIADSLCKCVDTNFISNNVVITNARHYEALNNTLNAVINIINGIEKNISTDLIAIELRQALHFLGEITGEITTDEILKNIFSKFCIGK